MAIGKLHLLLLHFPIALIITAALADILWLWRKKDFYRNAGFYCILLGAAAAIPTAITGMLLMGTMNLTGEFAELGEVHETFGILAAVAAVAAGALRALVRNRPSGLWAYAYAALIAGAVVLVGLAGHFGGQLAFGKDYLSI
jgi:uncharacterized membrane protein